MYINQITKPLILISIKIQTKVVTIPYMAQVGQNLAHPPSMSSDPH